MNILGLSFDFHDGAAALVRDGQLVGVAAEERFSLQKHDSSYPVLSLSAILQGAGCNIQDIDEVVYYEQPAVKYSRILTTSMARFPKGVGQFIAANKTWLGEKLWVRATLGSRFNLPPSKIHLVAHHHSHVAQAFLPSPFDDAAVLVLDGVGEWDCTTLAIANRNAPDVLKIVEQYEYPHSIGLVYAAFTAYLGFKPNSGEASTMALAAFGKPDRYLEKVRQVVTPRQDGTYFVEPGYFNFEGNSRDLFSAKMVETFGPPRDFKLSYGFDALADGQSDISEEEQRFADVAASLQEVLAELLLGLCARLRRITKSENLCVAGGVALNCLANTRLVKESGFSGVFIPPDPGDGGACFGAAMLRAAAHGKVKPLENPYLGCAYSHDELTPLFSAAPDLGFLLGKQTLGGMPATSISSMMMEDEDQLLDEVVADLAQGRIVAWVQGRFEVGARALGNRSLLVAAGKVDAVRRMSRTVKAHTHFRPYALSITAEDAPRILDIENVTPHMLKWMQSIWPVRSDFHTSLRGAIHVDGTTRPQVCSRSDNPRYWALLQRFGRHNGISALLNTSLNERSLPMVAHPRMALAMFARTGVDTLVIDNLLIRKKY